MLVAVYCVGRLDSLMILDVFLKHRPSLIADSAPRLLPNLLHLIAQPSQLAANSSAHRGQNSSTKMSSLIVNPNSRQSTQKWRVRVLRCLGAFFNAVVVHSQQQQSVKNMSATSSPVVTVTDSATTHHWIASSACVTQSSLALFTLRSVEHGTLYLHVSIRSDLL